MNRVSAKWLLFVVIVIDCVGLGIVIPALPFLAPNLGGNEWDVALLLAVFSLFAGIAGPFWGGLSDRRLGRRRVLAFCLFGGAISYILLGLATELWMLYCARALGGFMAGGLSVASALMADLSPPRYRSKAMGLVGVAFGLGMILGPLLGGLLAGDGESFLLIGLFAGSVCFLSSVLAMVLLKDSDAQKSHAAKTLAHTYSSVVEPIQVKQCAEVSAVVDVTKRANQTPIKKSSIIEFIHNSGSGLLVTQYALHTFAMGAIAFLTPLWLAAFLDWGPKDIGILFGLLGLVIIIIQGVLLGWLNSRFGLINVLSAGTLVSALSLVAAAFVDGVLSRIIVILMLFSSSTVIMPILNTITSDVVSHEFRGRMMGITGLFASFGRVVGPLVIGGVYTVTDYSIPWLLTALPIIGIFIWSRTVATLYCRDGLT